MDLKELLMKGYVTKVVNVGGIRFKLRSLSTSDVMVLTFAKERMVQNRIDMSTEMFQTSDSVLKIAMSLLEMDGEPIEPVVMPDQLRKMALMGMGIIKTEPEVVDEFISEVLMKKVQRVLDFPPQLLDGLVKAWNELQQELENAMKEGDLKNSSQTPGSGGTSGQSNTTNSTDTSQTSSS